MHGKSPDMTYIHFISDFWSNIIGVSKTLTSCRRFKCLFLLRFLKDLAKSLRNSWQIFDGHRYGTAAGCLYATVLLKQQLLLFAFLKFGHRFQTRTNTSVNHLERLFKKPINIDLIRSLLSPLTCPQCRSLSGGKRLKRLTSSTHALHISPLRGVNNWKHSIKSVSYFFESVKREL